MPKNSWISTKTPAIVPESARSARWEGMKAERRQVWQAYACDYCLPNSWTENWQAVRTRGDCAQSGVKRCPDVDSVAKDRSGAGDNECAEMSRTVKCVDCLWAHGRQSGKTCDTWAKDTSRAGSCNHFKISKTEKCVHCL